MRPTGLQRRAGPFKVKAPVGWAVRRLPWGFLAMPADTPRLFALSLLAAVVLSDAVLESARRELRRLSDVKLEIEELRDAPAHDFGVTRGDERRRRRARSVRML